MVGRPYFKWPPSWSYKSINWLGEVGACVKQCWVTQNACITNYQIVIFAIKKIKQASCENYLNKI